MKNQLPHQHGNTKVNNSIIKNLPIKEDFETTANIFKLLDDPNRLQIFWTLCHIEECVINLAEILNISSPALAHHLKVLKMGKIIESRRDGKEVFYKASNTKEVKAIHKAIEQIMMISCPERQRIACIDIIQLPDLSDQEKIIKEVHKYLAEHLDKRITIEELSHIFLINPTTLKSEFKKMYGTSIAAHIKEHRLEKAATLLLTTNMPVSAIARVIGYTNQSKFSSAFFQEYGCLPLEYRRNH